MKPAKLITAIAALTILSLAAPVEAGQHGGDGSSGHGGGSVGHAVPRGAVGGHAGPRSGVVAGHAVPRTSIPVRPHIVPSYRSYGHYYPYYGYPSIGLGFSYGYPGYYGHGFGYPWYGYRSYGYGYGYYGYPGYITAAPRQAYGRVHIENAPPDAQVFVDGYYAGLVDDFDGVRQYLRLEPGPHQVEIRAPELETLVFDVNVQPGQTITYRARMQPLQP